MENKKIIFIVITVLVLVLVAYGMVLMRNKQEDLPSVPSPQQQQQQGKIDINAVCNGALAYMTFPDGKSAEVFITECREGKHPEVIEKYKEQMGLGDGAAI